MKQSKVKKEQPKIETAGRTAKAVSKFIRIAPRKMRIVINTIRFQPPQRAFTILMTFKKKAARITEKVLKTAVANAKVLGLDENRLIISDVRADGGPMMKRFMERSMGRANRILKRTTHLSLTLKESEKNWIKPQELKAKEAEKTSPKAAKTESGRKKKAVAAGK